jgi:50S ribosomal subunit-associated GTPase HflX
MNVFVLQLKMQYKSKARQSTTADLQLDESISLVNTLEGWKVTEKLIVSSKKSASKEIFGSGNQEMLSKKIAASGANCLFVVIDRLTNLQVKSLRRTLLGNNPNIRIYDRYTIVLEIFKRNARSSIAKLQIALAEIPYIRHKFENNELYKNVEKKINRELEAKLKTRNLLNSQRRDKKIPTISVFGYTNVGKTSFIKLITEDNKMEPKNKVSEIFNKNKLFY